MYKMTFRQLRTPKHIKILIYRYCILQNNRKRLYLSRNHGFAICGNTLEHVLLSYTKKAYLYSSEAMWSFYATSLRGAKLQSFDSADISKYVLPKVKVAVTRG